MTRFAQECLKRMAALTKQLETTLGPSTGDLKGRCGLHSGQVTAGVLRGEKARFQLFGDTMNTASRMESSGVAGRIQISQETADLLRQAGKEHWIAPREHPVFLKGKGELQTFFVSPRSTRKKRSTVRTCSESNFDGTETIHSDSIATSKATDTEDERMYRMVDWNVEVLHTYLVKLVATYQRRQTAAIPNHNDVQIEPMTKASQVIHEMADVLTLPPFVDWSIEIDARDDEGLVPEPAKAQLRDFVSRIAHLYREVPFHNFEHASHVTLSAHKLMKRILHPAGIEDAEESQTDKARRIHEITYGISSDPLLQFSIVFAALIHDVDHTGFTNKELIDSKTEVAVMYRGKSVAEQNSVTRAWNLLMHERYADLRQCMFSTRQEQQRFRQLIVNVVMATDNADKELQARRKDRWDQAFQTKGWFGKISTDSSGSLASDRKATIVLEHIIQASDVAHCMQHWLTYKKYNTRLFEERYVAWLKSSSDAPDPSSNWYEGEIGFFDNYIIPLARKLKECGVFGVTYDECLSYAQQNRLEWERKGEAIVAEMLSDCRTKYGDTLYFEDHSCRF
jgi:3'5'-cyclic nucleotide phosphodiesterase/Adenylate and Guanylate cyclase catalytic domain